MIGNGLAYLSVAVRDVESVASTLETHFRLRKTECTVGATGRRAPVFPVGKTAVALFELGDEFVGGAEKTGVHHVAISVSNLESATAEASGKGVATLSGQQEAGLADTRRVLLDPQATLGIVTYLSEPLTLPSAESEMVERIDHIGVASENNSKVLDVFSNRFGWPVESTQTDAEITQTFESFTSDKYGVAHRARQPQLVGGLRVAFVTIGDCDLEVLQDIGVNTGGGVERGQPGSTSQDRSVISRFIDARGPGLHHVAFKVRDINRLLASLREAEHAMIDTVGRPGSRMAQIGFIHPASLGGWLVHLVEREELPVP
jgi:catechol 2,3-dioxygenase-like lactoylglutathione lyase family enzyme